MRRPAGGPDGCRDLNECSVVQPTPVGGRRTAWRPWLGPVGSPAARVSWTRWAAGPAVAAGGTDGPRAAHAEEGIRRRRTRRRPLRRGCRHAVRGRRPAWWPVMCPLCRARSEDAARSTWSLLRRRAHVWAHPFLRPLPASSYEFTSVGESPRQNTGIQRLRWRPKISIGRRRHKGTGVANFRQWAGSCHFGNGAAAVPGACRQPESSRPRQAPVLRGTGRILCPFLESVLLLDPFHGTRVDLTSVPGDSGAPLMGEARKEGGRQTAAVAGAQGCRSRRAPLSSSNGSAPDGISDFPPVSRPPAKGGP